MQLTNLSSGDYMILTGDISVDYKGFPPKIFISADFLTKILSTEKTYWVNDYKLNILDNDTDFEVKLAGRYYDPDYGYVDVSTPKTDPLIYDLHAEWPRSGEVICRGEKPAENKKRSSAILTAIDDTSYTVDADRDGDGVYELNLGPFLWSDL
jgi:hypothetical protein